MEYLHRLVEDRIQKAQEEGVFDNLPGKGKPLNLDDDSIIPEDLRLTFKVLDFTMRQTRPAALDLPQI